MWSAWPIKKRTWKNGSLSCSVSFCQKRGSTTAVCAHKCVCVYTCVYVFIYTCVCLYLHITGLSVLWASMYGWICGRLHTCKYVHNCITDTYMYISWHDIFTTRAFECVRSCLYAYTLILSTVQVHRYTLTHAGMHAQECRHRTRICTYKIHVQM